MQSKSALKKISIAVGVVASLALLFGGPFEVVAENQPSDVRMARAIERKLEASVPAHRVDVKSRDGVVTLSGSVDSLLARERATALAQSIRGVRAVVNRLSVRAPLRTDLQLRRDVKDALAADPATDTYDVDVDVADGVITLSGQVASWAEKQLAEMVAKGVRGARTVNNEIVARYRQNRSDSEIAADVQARLKWNPRIDDGGIKVSARESKVFLQGTVGSEAEKNLAYAEAWVAGVEDVDNRDLVVEWRSREKMRRGQNCAGVSDEDLKLAVRSAFLRDPRVSIFNPNVEVEDYVVTLTGVVENLKAKSAAADDAKNTTCVVQVKNFLKVRPFKVLPDQIVAEEVRAALERDSYTHRHDIAVSVSNGKVFLEGQVDTLFDLIRAEDVASRVNGVVELQNNIALEDILTTKTDLEIKQNIQDQLWWSPFVDSDAIKVSVKAEVATLTGTVRSLSEYEAATVNAYEGGAKKVVNQLEVADGNSRFW